MNSVSDNVLMLQVKSGETQKLGLLYERYKKRLFGFFYQMNKNASVSEDLVQNVFIRVLKYKHTYTEESKFVTWIFQIARNENYDNYKKQKKYRHKDIDEVGFSLADSSLIDADIEMSENSITLQLAMQQLSNEQRELLILSKIKELKYKEVGEVVGCTESNARVKVHRAFHKLKEIYLIVEKR